MASGIKIKKETVIKLFVELGFKTAGRWPTKKLQQKIKNLPELTDGVKIRKPKVRKILNAILAAKKVAIVDEAAEAEDKKLQKQMGGSKKTRDSQKKAKKVAKKKAPKGPGVISTILEIIKTKGPVSKEQIQSALTRKFPDRPKDGMMNTINIQVPSRLNKEKNAKIKKNAKGKYYIGR